MKAVEEKIAEGMCTIVLLLAALYFAGHVIWAALRGAFKVVIQ